MGLEVLDCPRCADRMQLIAAIEDPAVAAAILTHLKWPARPPPRGRPWRAQPVLATEHRADDGGGIDPPAFVQ